MKPLRNSGEKKERTQKVEYENFLSLQEHFMIKIRIIDWWVLHSLDNMEDKLEICASVIQSGPGPKSQQLWTFYFQKLIIMELSFITMSLCFRCLLVVLCACCFVFVLFQSPKCHNRVVSAKGYTTGK